MPSSAKNLSFVSLKNKNGLEMAVTNFGARVMSLKVPDKNGKLDDIVLGYDTPADYVNHHSYYGALVGRYANRISKGNFTLHGTRYHLPINNGNNHLHGGNGFQNHFWQLTPLKVNQDEGLLLEYLSKDGEDGYPGNLSVEVIFILNSNNEWTIEYKATTDQLTIVNLTQHNFYNLAGEGNGDILNHQLMIHADYITPIDKGMIPTGEFRKVENSPFDFRQLMPIGSRIQNADEQLTFGNGYDHNWVLSKQNNELSHAATVIEPGCGRKMEVWTTEPGLQLYTGNFLDGADPGKAGKTYPFRSALCLETQHFPDSPNHSQFPPTVLTPDGAYHQKTVHKFSVM